MHRTLKIGLTGGIGSGKSEALAAFGRSGAATLSLDEVSRRLSARGKPGYRAICRRFGPSILDPAGRIDRNALAKKIFANPRLRRSLEAVTHPPILREMKAFLKKTRGVAVIDVPLLFEKNLQDQFDVTVALSSPDSARLRRVMKRDRLPRAEVLRRMKSQIQSTRQRRLADVVIHNSGSLSQLRRSVREFQKAFELIAQHRKR